MHITRIKVKNFQIHKLFEAKLGPGVNPIIGAGDVGKSAIVRAVTWCLTNRPLGDDFRRYWYEDGVKHLSKKTEVEVEFNTGLVITRTQAASINRYTIQVPGEKPLELNKFGRDVPQQVVDATGIKVLKFGDTETCPNIQGQHDPYFLLAGLSGQAKWKALSALAGTEAADQAVASFNSDINQAGRQIKFLDKTLAEKETSLRQEETDLARLQNHEAELAGLLKKANAAQAKLQALSLLNQSLAENEVQAERMSGILERNKELASKLTTCRKGLTEAQGQWFTLSMMAETLKGVEWDARAYRLTLEQTAAVVALKLPREDADKLVQLQKIMKQGRAWRESQAGLQARLEKHERVVALGEHRPLFERYLALHQAVEGARSWQVSQKEAEGSSSEKGEALANLKAERVEALREAKICPTCGVETENHSACT